MFDLYIDFSNTLGIMKIVNDTGCELLSIVIMG